MNRFLFSLIFLAISLRLAHAQIPALDWVKQLRGPATDYSRGLHRHSDGSIYITGNFADSIDLDPGPGDYWIRSQGQLDMYVAKYDSSANLLWARQFGGPNANPDFMNSSALDNNGNIAFTGYIRGIVDMDPGPGTKLTIDNGFNGVIIKLDANGNFVFGNAYESNASLTVYQIYFVESKFDVHGQLYVTGNFGGTVDFDAGPNILNYNAGNNLDGVLLKLGPTGNLKYGRHYFSTGSFDIRGLGIGPDSSTYITGTFNGSTTLNSGGAVNFSATYVDAFVCKLNSSGAFMDAKNFGTSNWQSEIEFDKVRFALNGDLILAGNYKGSVDFDPSAGTLNGQTSGNLAPFVLKMQSGINTQWVRTFPGGIQTQLLTDLERDQQGNLYLCGTFRDTLDCDPGNGTAYLTNNGFQDIYVIKLNAGGIYQYSFKIGSNNDDFPSDLELFNPDAFHLIGTFNGNTDFEPGAGVVNISPFNFSSDVFWARYGAGGSVNPLVCSGTTTLNACSGSFTDGSGNGNYNPNLNCFWLINAAGASQIQFTFPSFQTEANVDFVKIYQGTNSSGTLIGSISGTNPLPLTVMGQNAFVEFITNGSNELQGFTINYQCVQSGPPVAQFSANPTIINTGNQVEFTDASLNNPGSWSWSFPGGNPAAYNGQNPPLITYNNPGCYDAVLIVSNAQGSDTLTQTCMIQVNVLTGCSELMFSEYVEGSANNKAIEIYNSSSGSINLSGYRLEVFSNGSSTPSGSINLNGSIAPHDVLVISNPNASIASIIAASDFQSSVISFNGNDAVVLLKNGNILDVIGNAGTDPGTAGWSTNAGNALDRTLIRLPNVNLPSSSWQTVQNQWSSLAIDQHELGSHASVCSSNPGSLVADFNPQDSTLCAGESTLMIDNSQNAVSWQWTCNGAIPSSSNLQQPVFSFPNPGNYTVQLVVTGPSGFDTETAVITVSAVPLADAGSDVQTCTGTPVNLNAAASGGNIYSWSPSGGLSAANILNPIANPSLTTNYVLSVSNGQCFAYDTVLVTVNPLPVMPQIQNNGGVLELQTGFGPYSSYQWYLNGSIVAGANQASLLPSFSGTYYVEVSNAFGCLVNSFPLTVAVNPNLTIAFFSPQDDTLCVGQSTLMNNNSQNANSYLWTCPGAIPPSSNLAQPSFSFPSPGSYQVQLIASGTTGTDTAYANVYVPVLPFVFGGNDQAICPGGFVQMNGITALNNVVQWSPAAGLSNPNLIAPIANPTQTTTYVVSVFDGYCINHDTVIVVVFPTPALPLIQFNNGQLTLQSGSGPYSGYQWILNGSALGGAFFQDLFPPQSGIYSLQVSDTNGCISTSDTIQVAVTGVHLGESYQDVIVYPNPAEGELTIQVSEPREIESIELQGLDGRLIKRINGLVFTEQTTLTREDCSAGMYALIIRTRNSEPKIIKVIYR